MSRVILHLGTHKAASTAIQMFWSRNREALADAGICYPLAPEPTPMAHHSLAWNLRARYVDVMRRPGNQSLDEVLEAFACSGAHTLLLSSEDFLTTSFFPGFLHEFSASLRDVFEQIVVCAYVRGRCDFFNSSYNQWIKSLSFADDFDTYLATNLATGRPQIHYTKALRAWGAMADEAIFIPFKSEVFDSHPERHLSRLLGLADEQLEMFSPVRATALNESIGAAAITAYRRLAGRLHETDWYEHFHIPRRKKLLQYLDDQARERNWTGTKFKPLTEKHRQQIERVFGDEDREFAERFLSGSWLSLFPQDHAVLEAVSTVEDATSSADEVESFVAAGFANAEAIFLGSDDEERDEVQAVGGAEDSATDFLESHDPNREPCQVKESTRGGEHLDQRKAP